MRGGGLRLPRSHLCDGIPPHCFARLTPPRQKAREPRLWRRQVEIKQGFHDDLDNGDRTCQYKIHQAGGEEDREEIEICGGQLRTAQRQFLHGHHGGKRRVLESAYRFVAERRNHRANRLRRHNAQHHHGWRHTKRLPGDGLASIDPDDISTNDFSDEWGFVKRKRQPTRLDRSQLYADHRQCVVAEDHLQDQRRSTKDDRIYARNQSQEGKPAELHAGEHDSHRQAAAEANGGDEKCVENAGEQIGLAEVVEE